MTSTLRLLAAAPLAALLLGGCGTTAPTADTAGGTSVSTASATAPATAPTATPPAATASTPPPSTAIPSTPVPSTPVPSAPGTASPPAGGPVVQPLPAVTRPAGPPKGPTDVIKPRTFAGVVTSVQGDCAQIQARNGVGFALSGAGAADLVQGRRVVVQGQPAAEGGTSCTGAVVRVIQVLDDGS